MTEQNKQDVLGILGIGLAKIVNNCTENALLINSSFVATHSIRNNN